MSENTTESATDKVKYPAYQCFKTKDRDVYCSRGEVNNHEAGAEWVSNCMAHFNIKASDLLGKPYPSIDQPSGATIWPEAA